VSADIEARLKAGTIDDEGYRAQSSARAYDKQKILDALFRAGLLPEHLPRRAEDYPELTNELHHAIVGFLALTPSQLLSINQEDITREVDQQNLPGTTWQYPNWRRKMRFTIEELQSDPQALALSETFRDWIFKSGRANAAAAPDGLAVSEVLCPDTEPRP
jgi:4-alpha-glucanotransferase